MRSPGTPRARNVDVNGTLLGYRETGAAGGRPVVLLHALASSAATWDQLAAELGGAGFRVIALDLPGHGSSARTPTYGLALLRDQVRAFLDELALTRVDLIGHSLGGNVATLVAQSEPDRVRRLVLEDIPPPPRDDRSAPPRRGRTLRLIKLGLAQLAGGRGGGFDRGVVRPIIAELRAPNPGWWHDLAAVKAPTLVISGGPGSHNSPARLREVASALPDARMVTIEAGHRIHSTRPAEFAAAVLPFLAAPDSA
ncbi:alpha/beta fold hydrolase [Actinopolymorpha pittospori]|uniref:Pimeloyl-ACP methyl ester carboxylesterase n=1 Tax=Actinopolymorpha pittospori TaxID=648752 RepID=A0A927MSZ8_9ACTN|nr:alpha/beta fold hydrolase [Actinopolymorpha pittospori]MBE1606084.1 pimeloyl-ACP methyl ester carboxylesterase [Actinopolymorpha pittospori]